MASRRYLGQLFFAIISELLNRRCLCGPPLQAGWSLFCLPRAGWNLLCGSRTRDNAAAHKFGITEVDPCAVKHKVSALSGLQPGRVNLSSGDGDAAADRERCLVK